MAKSKKSKYRCILDRDRIFVNTLVSDLGSNVKTIAKRLKARGIKGYQGEGSSCPLANYFLDCGFDEVSVPDSDVVEMFRLDDELFPMPKAFRNFVSQFDDGKFPELVEER